jgi:hypothetical protein
MNSGADPGFHAREGALENIAPSGGRCEHFWGISCEKCPILGGGGGAPGAPTPRSAPGITRRQITWTF